jgi:hypothetical protein
MVDELMKILNLPVDHPMKFIEPQRIFNAEKCISLVAELTKDYDIIVFTVSSEMAEAIRNYKINNYKKKNHKFAQWFSLAIKEGGRELRWCQVG